MKKGISSTLVLLLSFSLSFAQYNIDFQQADWSSILLKAGEQNKLVFIDAYTTWCAPCKQMDKEVFNQKKPAEFYNKNFINFKIDMEKGEGPTLAKQYSVAQYPTYLFVAADGTLIHRAAGFHNPEALIALGTAALDPSKQLSTLEKRFTQGDREPDFLKSYTALRAASYDGSHVPIAEAYLESQSARNDQETRSFVFRYLGGADSPLFNHLIQHRQDYIQQFGSSTVDEKINMIIYDHIAKNSTKESPMHLEEVAELYKKAYPEKAKEMFSQYKISHYRSIGDRMGFAKAAIKHYKKYPSDDPGELNEVAWTFYSVIDHKRCLKQALKLSKKSVAIDPAFYNHDTLAALYYKLGKKEKALQTAEKAIELAKQEGYGEDGYADTLQLIQEIKQGQ